MLAIVACISATTLYSSPCAANAPLRHVLNVRGQADPSVHAFFVDREAWLGEGWLGECTNWNGDAVFSDLVVHRCATSGAEVERDSGSFIPDTGILCRSALDRHALPAEASLSTKHTSGSALACETVADRNANWIFRCRRSELPAATGCNSCAHGG